MLKEPKRIIAEEPQSPDRWLKEPRNNHISDVTIGTDGFTVTFFEN